MLEKQEINIHNVKSENISKVLKLICANDNLARISISKITNLTKMTISNIVSGLMHDNLVVEYNSIITSSAGPNPITLRISPSAPLVVGLAIRRKRIGLIVATLDMQILKEMYLPFDFNCSEKGIILICKRLIDIALKEYSKRIAIIGITSPGPINTQSGTILNPPKLFAFNNFEIISLLKKEYDIPMFLEKDAIAACLLEKNWGNGKSLEQFALIMYTSGIGMCISSDLYADNNSLAGEIGHTTINYDGKICSCGKKGCLETYTSCDQIINNAKLKTGVSRTFLQCLELYKKDAAITAIIDESIRYLAIGLSNVNNTLAPENFLMCGQGSDFTDSILNDLQQQINELAFNKTHNNVRVMRSKFGKKANLYGSGCFAIEKFVKLYSTNNLQIL